MTEIKADIDIAREAKKKKILDIAKDTLGLDPQALEPYGHFKAKVPFAVIDKLKSKKDAKLVLVTAMTPTTAGEGKTTTSVGLADGMNKIGKKTIVALREPSLGPVFGMKGGAAGGGYAQIVPMDDINLHFTGDFHAISSANNLLAAMIDNHVYWGKDPLIDVRRISWRRAVDMNDRALRSIVNSLGGVSNGFPREDGFDITVASEVMAIFCLANDLKDLQNRLGNIIVGYSRDKKPITAREIKADGAMTALLRDALQPNLVQTLENNPAFVHGGPFANIAHGCNTVLATKTAMKLADYVITEAGFGADLGAEKFFDIKCRKAGLEPSAVVLVATIRALKYHGGVDKDQLNSENLKALEKGMVNLERHFNNMQNNFGLPCIICINHFVNDTDAEVELLKSKAESMGAKVVISKHWADGGAGAEDLAKTVVEIVDSHSGKHKYVYEDNDSLWEKIEAVATKIYGASGITAPPNVRAQIDKLNEDYGSYPVCIAKTQMSFSADPSVRGAPSGHTVAITEARLASGAGFIVVIAGNMMTMPGLPKVPAAEKIDVDSDGKIVGLF